MNLTKFSIDRPISIAMVIAFFVVLGLFSFYRIGVELLPALNTPPMSPYPLLTPAPMPIPSNSRSSSLRKMPCLLCLI